MTNEAEGPPISWPLRVDNIRDGASGEIDATQAEMAASARMLDLLGLERLTFAYRLRHGAGGRLRLTGSLKAAVTQTCVVSLNPVEASLDVPVEVEFLADFPDRGARKKRRGARKHRALRLARADH